MMRKSYYIPVIVGLLTAYACDDDKDGSANQNDNDSNQVTELGEGDPCVKGDSKKKCKAPLICDEGTCKTSAQHEDVTKCTSDSDCADKDEDHKKCLDNGKCGKIVDLGEECSDEDQLCQEGAECYYQRCTVLLDETKDCSLTDEKHICDATKNLNCIDGKCRAPKYGLILAQIAMTPIFSAKLTSPAMLRIHKNLMSSNVLSSSSKIRNVTNLKISFVKTISTAGKTRFHPDPAVPANKKHVPR